MCFALVKTAKFCYCYAMQARRSETGLILASRSPRRRQLMETAGLVFTVCPSRVRESDYPFSEPAAYVKTLAEAKAADVSERHPASWVVGADSIVWLGGRLLEKPGTREAAVEMMELLSGRTHHVYTGYSIICRQKGHCRTDAVETAVTVKPLSFEEIAWYTATGEPYDKAGGYAIQGLGSFMIQRISGSYTNVVGLPLCELMDHLIREGVIFPSPNRPQWESSPSARAV